VILWTRISGTTASLVTVDWQVALDVDFKNIVASGSTETSPERDYTVKIDPELPRAGTTYYYRFNALGTWSMIGRTRTTPHEASQVRLAVVSCSSIWSGYFNAYNIIAGMNDIDAVIHLGDYIYNEPDPDELRNMPLDPMNSVAPDSLEAVRQRYRYFRQDPFLQKAHQQHPWVIVWDNHDIENRASKADNIRAFHEWVPLRSPNPNDPAIIYRSLKFGNLADLIMLDTRHIGRGTLSNATGQPSILGDAQFDWLTDEIKQSRATWRIIGNQVLMAPWKIATKVLSPINWDGFDADRRRVLGYLKDSGTENTLVITGDAHLSFAANLDIDGSPVAVEFLPTSVTRGNLDEQVKDAFESIAALGFEAATRLFNPHIKYFESRSHGFGLVDLKEGGATLEFWYVPHEELSDQCRFGHSVFVPIATQRISKSPAVATSGPRLGQQAPVPSTLYNFSTEIGGTGGSYFDDCEVLPPTARLKSISLSSGLRIDGIALSYQNDLVIHHGGSGGSDQTLVLEPGEYIRRVVAAVGKHRTTVSIHYLRIETSRGQIVSGGVQTPHTMDFTAPPGYHIVGFRGRAGLEVDKLGAIFAPDFEN
jgi:alkaline phosphatase D